MARRMDNANSQGGAGKWSVTANSASPLVGKRDQHRPHQQLRPSHSRVRRDRPAVAASSHDAAGEHRLVLCSHQELRLR